MRRKWAVLGSRPHPRALPGAGRGVAVLPVRRGSMAEAQASSNASDGQVGALDLWIGSVRRMGPLRNFWHDAGCVASPEILHSFVESHSRKRFPPDDKCPRGSLRQRSSRGGRIFEAHRRDQSYIRLRRDSDSSDRQGYESGCKCIPIVIHLGKQGGVHGKDGVHPGTS